MPAKPQSAGGGARKAGRVAARNTLKKASNSGASYGTLLKATKIAAKAGAAGTKRDKIAVRAASRALKRAVKRSK